MINKLKIKIFADTADLNSILKLCTNPLIKGFTTNPTLMRKAGILDYEDFSRKLISLVPNHPLSLEVFADDLLTMEAQAKIIASWGKNVNVKIPVTTTKGEFIGPIIERLSATGVMVNITAVFTLDQINAITRSLRDDMPVIISIFAGRIADTGIDPVPLMTEAVKILKDKPKVELIWASPRELLNIFQANDIGCHIITVTLDILNKLSIVNKNLEQYSLETIQTFYKDANIANYVIK
ncbi:MAG: transaldolase [Rhodospirillaceae bacterium]|nr:transaldolase [Rhodospirillaceae bacterium]